MQTNTVFFDVVMSLDGFIAPEGMDLAHANDPEYKQWMNKWMALQQWVFQQKFFRENLNLGEGGERFWPEEAPFHTPVFVLTDQVRNPWQRRGGTTFYFVNDGIESALRQAREVAGNRDSRIAGGANAIQQYLHAGLIDEFTIHYAPVFFGRGLPLFANMNPDIKVKMREIVPSKEVAHITYEVEKE